MNRGFLKEKLDILCVPIHERYESNLSKTGHNFWAWRGKQVKDWNSDFAPIPPNYFLLNPERGEKQIPPHVDIDLVISGNKFGCFQIMGHYANKLDVPLISVEHTAPHPNWPKHQLDALKSMRGDINIFISEWSRRQWGWNEDEAIVIYHGIDTNTFRLLNLDRKPYILTTVNEYSNPQRHWCCGWPLYKEVTNGLEALNVGNDPPFSKPAKSVEDLVKYHNESSVFLNTSSYSPIPMSVLEAMSCFIEGSDVFLDYNLLKVEELFNLQTFDQKIINTRVLKKHKTKYSGIVNSIKTNFLPKIDVTENHPIATCNINKKFNSEYPKTKKNKYLYEIDKIVYKSAKDINIGDWLVYPKFKKEIPTNLSKEWLRFYGLFLAEGNVEGNRIKLTFHEKETHLIEEVKNIAQSLNRGVYIGKAKDSKAIQVSFGYAPLARKLVEMFHKYSHEKNIPKELMEASKEEVKIFLDAYLDGDGYRQDVYSSICSTTSKQLAYQLSMIFSKIDMMASVTTYSAKKGIIRGREFNGKPIHVVRISMRDDKGKCKKKYKEDKDNFYLKVIKKENYFYNGNVYNYTTDSGTYQCPLLLVHNCGSIVVSLPTCMIPEVITHGENGILVDNPKDMRNILIDILKNRSKYEYLGKNARKTILEKFSLEKFVSSWNGVFNGLHN